MYYVGDQCAEIHWKGTIWVPRCRNILKMYYVGDQSAEIHWKCIMWVTNAQTSTKNVLWGEIWVTKAQIHCLAHFHKLHDDHIHAQMLLYIEIWVTKV